jgi:hypothetical protein
MWDGDAISGPVPTLYADNVELAKKAIVADPAKAHQVLKYVKNNQRYFFDKRKNFFTYPTVRFIVLNLTQDLLRLMGKFLINENVLARGACNVVDSPREGEVIQPFKKGSFNKNCITGPSSSGSNKRPRLEASPSETGV